MASSTEEVVFVGKYEGAGFDAGVDRSAAKMARLRGEVAKADDERLNKLGASVKATAAPLDEAAAKMARLRGESEKMEKIASLLGPRVGSLVALMSKLGKTAGSDIGGATLAMAGAAAGAGALLYAVTALGAGVVDTITNIDDLAASLDVVTRKRLAEQIESLRESKKAFDEAEDSWTEFKIVVADVADGPLSDMVGLLAMAPKGWAIAGTAARGAGVDFRNAMGPLGDFLQMLEKSGEIRRLIAQSKQAALDEGAKTGWSGPGGIFPMDGSALDGGMSIPPVAPPTAPKPVEAPRPVKSANRGPSMDSVMAGMTSGVVVSEAEKQADAMLATWMWLGDQLEAEDKARVDLAIVAMNREHNEFVERAAAEVALTRQYEAEKMAIRQAAAQRWMATAANAAAGIGQIADNLMQHEVDSSKAGTLAYIYAVNDKFGVAKAFALSQAIMNTAIGFTQEGATKGLAGLATGAALAVGLGVQIATIATQQPPGVLHTGGAAAPDELTIRTNEALGVLTAEGARNRQGLADVNAGRGGERERDIYLVDDRGTSRLRRFAKPNPDLGLSLPGFRT